jgi:hypothetical protein
MTRQSNAPSGWHAFRALRQPPVPIPDKQHGNFRHGDYSRARIEGMRQVRECVRMLRICLGR